MSYYTNITYTMTLTPDEEEMIIDSGSLYRRVPMSAHMLEFNKLIAKTTGLINRTIKNKVYRVYTRTSFDTLDHEANDAFNLSLYSQKTKIWLNNRDTVLLNQPANFGYIIDFILGVRYAIVFRVMHIRNENNLIEGERLYDHGFNVDNEDARHFNQEHHRRQIHNHHHHRRRRNTQSPTFRRIIRSRSPPLSSSYRRRRD